MPAPLRPYNYEINDNFTVTHGRTLALEAQQGSQTATEELIERHLYIPAHLARLSMNEPSPTEDNPGTELVGNAPWRMKNSHDYWVSSKGTHDLPEDFTTLESPISTVDERTQVGNEGLLFAIKTFTVGRHNFRQRPVPFSEWAAVVVKQAIFAEATNDQAHDQTLPLDELRFTNLNDEEIDEREVAGQAPPSLSFEECWSSAEAVIDLADPKDIRWDHKTLEIFLSPSTTNAYGLKMRRHFGIDCEQLGPTEQGKLLGLDGAETWREVRKALAWVRRLTHKRFDFSDEYEYLPAGVHNGQVRSVGLVHGTGTEAIRAMMGDTEIAALGVRDGREHTHHV